MTMTEYIEREKVLDICEKHYRHCIEMHDYCGDTTADNIKEDIEKLSISDVVEVVRCKDCKHYNRSNCSAGCGWCECYDNGATDERFCSCGERKNDNG
jgi:hypothetical protein